MPWRASKMAALFVVLSFQILFFCQIASSKDDSSKELILDCPDPAHDRQFGDKCYAFYEDAKVRTYDDAVAYCLARDMRLSAPQTPEEQLFFTNVIESQGWTRALIGLYFTQSTWRWSSDDTFLRGQGCNEQISIEDAALQGSGTYSDSLTPRKCIDLCTSESAQFAAVMGGSMCYCASQYVWQTPGSSCSLPCSGSMDQVCGSTLNSLAFSTQPDAYDNWMLGHPAVGGSCASLKIDHSTNPWVETSCNLALPFICRFSSVASTRNSLETAGIVQAKMCQDGACFYLYSTPDLVWSDADAFCIKYGGRLAKIESSDRQSQINTIFADSSVTVSQAWIGATNRFWIYESDETSALTASFRGWINVLEPISPESNQCAVMTLQDDGSYGWKTKLCTTLVDTRNRFVCEAFLTNVTRTTTKRTTAPPQGSELTEEQTTMQEFTVEPEEPYLPRTRRPIVRTTRKRSKTTTIPHVSSPPSTPRPTVVSTVLTTKKAVSTMKPIGSTPRLDTTVKTPGTPVTSQRSTTSKVGTQPPVLTNPPATLPITPKQPYDGHVTSSLMTQRTNPVTKLSATNPPATPKAPPITSRAETPSVTHPAVISVITTQKLTPKPYDGHETPKAPPVTSRAETPSVTHPAVLIISIMTTQKPPDILGPITAQAIVAETPAAIVDPGNHPIVTISITVPRLCSATCRNVTTFLSGQISESSIKVTTVCWPRGAAADSSPQVISTPPTHNGEGMSPPPFHGDGTPPPPPSNMNGEHGAGVTPQGEVEPFSINGPVYDAEVDCQLLSSGETTSSHGDSNPNGNHGTGGTADHGTGDQTGHGNVDNHNIPFGGVYGVATTAGSNLYNNGLSWWAILLIVLGCLAVVGAGIGIAVYFLKKSQSAARVAHHDAENGKRQPDTGSESSMSKNSPATEKRDRGPSDPSAIET